MACQPHRRHRRRLGQHPRPETTVNDSGIASSRVAGGISLHGLYSRISRWPRTSAKDGFSKSGRRQRDNEVRDVADISPGEEKLAYAPRLLGISRTLAITRIEFSIPWTLVQLRSNLLVRWVNAMCS